MENDRLKSADETSAPFLEFVAELRVTVGPIAEVGAIGSGIRRFVPITGGDFAGPKMRGRVLPGGADWQSSAPDGLTQLDARYVLETEDQVRIEVRNQGIRHAPPPVLERMLSGEIVDPLEYYFRTTPRFTVSAGKYEWLMQSVFIGIAERYPDLVVVRVWNVH